MSRTLTKSIGKRCYEVKQIDNDVLEIVVEITKLIKLSPKREQLLGALKENFEIENTIVWNKTILWQNLAPNAG